MKKRKKKQPKQPKKVKDISYENTPAKDLNPHHKEDFEKAMQMIVPRIKPVGIKGDKLLED